MNHVEHRVERPSSDPGLDIYRHLYPDLALSDTLKELDYYIERAYTAARLARYYTKGTITDRDEDRLVLTHALTCGTSQHALDLAYGEIFDDVDDAITVVMEPEFYYIDDELQTMSDFIATFNYILGPNRYSESAYTHKMERIQAVAHLKESGQSYEEIAAQTDISPSHARNMLLHRAVAQVDFDNLTDFEETLKMQGMEGADAKRVRWAAQEGLRRASPSNSTAQSRRLYFAALNSIRTYCQTGEALPTMTQLARDSGYAALQSARKMLQKYGLHSLLREAKEEEKIGNMKPGHEYAYLIGLVSVGGYASVDDGQITITLNGEAFRDAVGAIAARVFNVDPRENDHASLTYYNRYAARELGDLRRYQWPRTIVQKHSWIVEQDSHFFAHFIRGLFDGKFVVGERTVFFESVDEDELTFVQQGLERIGVLGSYRFVASPAGSEDRFGTRETYRLAVASKQDLHILAQTIRSNDPAKESFLAEYREMHI